MVRLMTSPIVARERARCEIVDAASALFAEHGYAGASMRDLARKTHRSLASFYLYFSSKEDLLFAVHARAFGALIASAEAAVETTREPQARLRAFILSHVRYVADHPDVMRVLIHEVGVLPPEHRRVVREYKDRYFAIGRGLVAAILPDDPIADAAEVERCAYTVFGMINWAWSWYDESRHGSPEQVATTLHRVAVHGLTGAYASRRPSQPTRPTELP